MNLARVFAFLLVSLISSVAVAQDWFWAGYEIVGYKKVTRAQVEALIPIAMGSKFQVDFRQWNDICDHIQVALDLYKTHCSAVRYVDFKTYFVVEVIEKGDEARAIFRTPPTSVARLTDLAVKSLDDRRTQRRQFLFSQGIAVLESHDKGYVDYTDNELSQIAAKLAQAVPSLHDNLLEILSTSGDPLQRRQAADLLNWDLRPAEDILAAVNGLDDPDEGVRNNMAHFTLAFVDQVKAVRDRETLVDACLLLLTRPSHTDRSQAIYSLLNLVTAFPGDAPYIKQKGFSLIQSVARQSILFNVRDVALDLIKRL